MSRSILLGEPHLGLDQTHPSVTRLQQKPPVMNSGAALAGGGKTYLLMKTLFAPCDKTGFLPFRFAPRGLVSSLRLLAPLVFGSPPLGEITEVGKARLLTCR